MAAPRFAMVAGEASGDLLAGHVLDAMRARWPQLAAAGIGGAQMHARGFEPWWPAEKLSVSGYAEVLKHLREILRIREQLRDRLLAERPDVFIGVDAPDFNLGLEQQLRAGGVKTVHFVCPSIWAWRMKRVEKLKKACDHVLCIFPFEPELLAKHGIPATYVGHPLAAAIPLEPDRTAARRTLGLPLNGKVIALLPGSRASEVEALTARFLKAAALFEKLHPDSWFVIPAVPALQARISQIARGRKGPRHLTIVTGQSHGALAACDVALVASGTATLEAALFKRPMVIAYRTSWLTYALMKPRQLQPWVGLPNILCREFVVPELLQANARPHKLCGALAGWFAQPDRMRSVQERFHALHLQLLRDTATLATDAIEKVLAS
ncbi:MAG TPA: lipid-A-disaccharide synthase [Ramlibacter sp.]|uniref:lipid-A-disaccharide synthase n=1 Tax=Ramlibacter sp. TaxID=1917967 RepID=UPI002D7ED2F0|nr:lipid-A-disaccharide synthase [Ramlibacter sp.]HET8744189.1 lipid-A-disaccharide synthase [Ramlibacter sp.]